MPKDAAAEDVNEEDEGEKNKVGEIDRPGIPGEMGCDAGERQDGGGGSTLARCRQPVSPFQNLQIGSRATMR